MTDREPLAALLGELHADYPGWCFTVVRCYDELRVEAHRPQAPSGLYAMMTADPAELRRELDNATC